MRCSGRGLTFGSLGYASTDNVGDDPGEMPPPEVDIGGKAVQVFASGISFSTCALLEDQTLRCWGYNKFGQLGYGHTNHIGDDETPASAGPVPY